MDTRPLQSLTPSSVPTSGNATPTRSRPFDDSTFRALCDEFSRQPGVRSSVASSSAGGRAAQPAAPEDVKGKGKRRLSVEDASDLGSPSRPATPVAPPVASRTAAPFSARQQPSRFVSALGLIKEGMVGLIQGFVRVVVGCLSAGWAAVTGLGAWLARPFRGSSAATRAQGASPATGTEPPRLTEEWMEWYRAKQRACAIDEHQRLLHERR